MGNLLDETLILQRPNDEMAELLSPTVDDDDSTPNIDSEEPKPTSDATTGPDEFCKAEIYLPHGDRNKIAKVLGRKRDKDGNNIGRHHRNPVLDSRIFTVDFLDGEH